MVVHAIFILRRENKGMRQVLVTLAFAFLLSAILAVAFVCPQLGDPLKVDLAGIACIITGGAGAWICLAPTNVP